MAGVTDANRIECPVVGCEGLRSDHDEEKVEDNLHRVTGPTLSVDYLDIDYFMSADSWPHWWMDVEGVAEMSPDDVLEMIEDLKVAAAFTRALNDAIDKAAS